VHCGSVFLAFFASPDPVEGRLGVRTGFGYGRGSTILEYFLPGDIVFGEGDFIGQAAGAASVGGGGDYRLWFRRRAVWPIVARVMGHSAAWRRDIKVTGSFCRYGGKSRAKSKP